MRGMGDAPGAAGLRCWPSASSSSCPGPGRDPVYLGTWAFCLYLETREKGRQFHESHEMDQDEAMSLPDIDITSDRRDLTQHC